MSVIVVANPKGGVGKTTLATNLAGYLASRGDAVVLGDMDRQQSARSWLALRPDGLAPIGAWDVAPDADDIARPPKEATHAVLDTPAALHGRPLDQAMKLADKVLVPLQPSIFDIHAVHEFVRRLLAHRRSERVQMAVVGMRTREGTIATDKLREFLDSVQLPLLGFLRDTQNYVHLAAHGLTLWDVSTVRVERDLEQWQPVIAWLDA